MFGANGKYESPFTIKILDENYELLTLLQYSNLQWNRKYNAVGVFSIELSGPMIYTKNWKYVYTEARKELGVITQVNWKKNKASQTVTISGYFAEYELNNMICFSKPSFYANSSGTHYGTSVLTPSPDWVSQEDTADVVALAFFNAFKQISWKNYKVGDDASSTLTEQSAELDITAGAVDNDHGVYLSVCHTRNNERLADKLYDILRSSKASFQVLYDFENNTKTLNIVHGIDRSQSGHAFGVNPVSLSTKNGTIATASVVTSVTSTKDAVIQYQEGNENEDSLILINAKPDNPTRFMVSNIVTNQSEYIKDDTADKPTADKNHKLAVLADATNMLLNNQDVINIQVDYQLSSYRYMEDFDLGDIISVDIPEIDLSFDAQIVECNEVVKSGTWSLNLTLGDAIIRKRGNV